MMDAAQWAEEEFGLAQLGNAARTRRLVSMVTRLADAPAGKVTEVFQDAAALEGAYRFLGNTHFGTHSVAAASYAATARRARGRPFVFVPVDGSSLQVTDEVGTRGLGIVGTRQKGARGIKVMTAIAVAPAGTPLGLCGQHCWVRREVRRRHHKQRELKDKETRHWLTVMEQAREGLRAEGVPAWFQLDREADFRELLQWAEASDCFLTVRSNVDRRLVDGRHLEETLEQAAGGCFVLRVPAGHRRQAREAWCELRYCDVTLRLKGPRSSRCDEANLRAVLVRELGTTPPGEQPVHWRLLTNRLLHSADDAWEVVEGYALRWRIEDFHKTWKSVCCAEDTQLGSFLAIERWCMVLAAVAMRVERLKHLGRNQPALPASVELTRTEIEALLLVAAPDGYHATMPTIGEAVQWIANMGGYTGKSSGGPPGAIVLGRGLKRLDAAVFTLKAIKRKKWKT